VVEKLLIVSRMSKVDYQNKVLPIRVKSPIKRNTDHGCGDCK